MANSSSHCPAPFLNEADFPNTGGILAGRLCAPVHEWLPGNDLTCCLPCPSSDYVYPESFVTWYRISEGINALSIALCLFLLASFIALPADKTRRHYLSVCLVVTVIVEALGFVVPLGVRPDQCHDAITPNDMFSSMTCAWSGALIVAGGLGIVVWVFVRALSINLQICWNIVPGQKFFYCAQAGGWGIVAVIFTLTTVLTGYSFRFGDACHVNSQDSLKVFWGPLLGISGVSLLLQVVTTAYCINVYLKNMWSDGTTEGTATSSGLPSYSSSINTHSAKAVYTRVRKCLWLQWRSMLIVVFILADVIFFSVVFLWMDNVITDIAREKDLDRVLPWLVCLFESGKLTDECSKLGQHAIVNQSTVVAVLLLLGLAGTQIFILLVRRSMFVGWYEFFQRRFSRSREFVSVDAKRLSGDNAKPFELFRVGSQEPLVAQSASAFNKSSNAIREISPYPSKRPNDDVNEIPLTSRGMDQRYLYPAAGPMAADVYQPSRAETISSTDSKGYRVPDQSFSGPRVRDVREQKWDLRSMHARGGLGLNPPSEQDDDEYEGTRNGLR